MAVLEHLEPGRVFHFFEQMSAIPRGSGNTKAVSEEHTDIESPWSPLQAVQQANRRNQISWGHSGW